MVNLDKKLMMSPKYQIGFLQAAGVTIYIIIFIVTVLIFSPLVSQLTRSGVSLIMYMYPAFFLMAFIISALATGSMILAYPVWLVTKGRTKDAALVIAWSIAWLIIFMFTLFIISIVKL